jgi:3-hydroxybutyryl-CoA dehydrogenase
MNIGVIGAGVMGSGVAQNLAQSNYKVMLIDISDEILNKTKQEIINNLRFQGMFGKKEKVNDPQAVLDQITFSTDMNLLEHMDFIIENVIEKWDIKKDVYSKIDNICHKDCIFAANTSAIPITRIASATKRPKNVIGIHFMNPVPVKTMAEVIRGYHTSEETIEKTKNLLSTMGKECVVVNDSPGFVSNRVLMLTINEAIYLIHENVAPAEDVDQIFKSCFEHKMGPLETADLIGLDTILYSLDVLYENFNDSKYRPCPLLKKMVDAGLHGRKNGQGFYNYHTQF